MSEASLNTVQPTEAGPVSSTSHRIVLGIAIVLLAACGISQMLRPPLSFTMFYVGLIGLIGFLAIDITKVKRSLLTLESDPAGGTSVPSLRSYLLVLGLSLCLLAAAGVLNLFLPPLNQTVFYSGLIGLIAALTLRLVAVK